MPAERLTSHHPHIRVERDGHVTTVTIDRPESKNGCTGSMWVALGAAFREVAYSGARAVVLTGAGGNFCAGADLSGATDEASSALAPAPSRNNLDGMRVLSDVVLAIHFCDDRCIFSKDIGKKRGDLYTPNGFQGGSRQYFNLAINTAGGQCRLIR